MLSDNIDTLRLWLEKYRVTGVVMEPQAIGEICDILTACAEDARQLAGAPSVALPENVVNFPTGSRMRRPVGTSGGGDAA